MRSLPAFLLTTLVLLGFGPDASAQYTKSAGRNAPMVQVERAVRGDDGVVRNKLVEEKAPADRWGNAHSNNYDLAVDGAFDGQTVAVMQFYTEAAFDFSLPKAALKEKGFSVYRWVNSVPSPADLEIALAKASQLWIISGSSQLLTPAHVQIIKRYFDAGHGVYIWGDNEPYYADANVVAEALFGTKMLGNVQGEQTLDLQTMPGKPGILQNHLLTTGLEHMYEGHTIATIQPNHVLTPLVYGSAGNLVTAYYDKDGRRAILDGGFTRLYMKWDTAGTARYVKNAASWLVNAEKFGDTVVNPALKRPPVEIAAPVPTSVPTIATGPAPTVAPVASVPSFLATNTIGLLLLALLVAFIGMLYIPALHRQD